MEEDIEKKIQDNLALNGLSNADLEAYVSERIVYLMTEVFIERLRQNRQWGGVLADDEKRGWDWTNLISHQNSAGHTAALIGARNEWRSRMIKVAALALAALESHDRLERESGDE